MVDITNEDNLPSVTVDIADRRLSIRPPAPGTKLTILGTSTSTSFDVNEPTLAIPLPLGMRGARHADGTPSELSLALAEAVAAGARNVELVKIATERGEDAAYTANDRFDDIEAAFDVLKLHPLDVVVLVNAFADESGLSGTSPGGRTRSQGFVRLLGDFCYAATAEFGSVIGVLGVRPLMKTANEENWTGAPTSATGELFDDPSLSFVQEWADHLTAEAGTLEDHSAETALVGYLAGSVETSPGVIDSGYNLWARDEAGTIVTDRDGNNVDGGAYVAVTAMLVRAINDEAQALANYYNVPAQTSYNALSAGAVGYAALLTVLAPHESTTNKPIPGYVASRRMPLSVARTITRSRMVTMVQRTLGLVVQLDPTAAHNGSEYTRSDFVRTSTVRIVHAALDVVRSRAEPYLSRRADRVGLAALKSEVDAGLSQMRSQGALQRFSSVIRASSDAQILGQVSIDLELVPAFQIEEIQLNVSLARPDDIQIG